MGRLNRILAGVATVMVGLGMIEFYKRNMELRENKKLTQNLTQSVTYNMRAVSLFPDFHDACFINNDTYVIRHGNYYEVSREGKLLTGGYNTIGSLLADQDDPTPVDLETIDEMYNKYYMLLQEANPISSLEGWEDYSKDTKDIFMMVANHKLELECDGVYARTREPDIELQIKVIPELPDVKLRPNLNTYT